MTDAIYQVYNCGGSASVPDFIGLRSLHANGTRHQGDSFCRAVAPHDAKWKNYDVSISLYNRVETGRSGAGVAGVMYNVEDRDNYDYAMFALG